jgi:hypothetical protein
MEHELKEVKCSCGKLLFKCCVSKGIVEIKCRKCGKIFRYEVK